MNKTLKRAVIVIAVIAVTAGCVWVAMTLIRNASKKPVNVYPVSNLSMSGYYGDMSTSGGQITTKDIQNIYVSDTQTITEIYVTEGQHVSKGEALFKYDTTMSEIDLKKAELDLEKKKLELDTTQKELSALYNAVSLEALQAEYESVSRQYNAEYEAEAGRRAEAEANKEKPPYQELPLGGWSESDPRYVNMNDASDINKLFEESGTDDVYVVFVKVIGDDYLQYIGLHLIRKDTLSIEFFEAGELSRQGESDTEEAESIDNDTLRSLERQMEYLSELMAGSYTRAEIIRMQNEKTKRIGELDIEIRMADVELQRKQKEFDDGVVTSEIDGIVKSMEYPEIANQNNEPSMVISAGGGYYINATVSELEMSSVTVGQLVTVNSWSTGVMCEGTVNDIGNEPVESNYYYGGDNNNVSWYPMVIYVDGNQNLKEGDYAEVSYEKASSSSDAWYLENMMIREENGHYYVYIRDENGLLRKQFIQTGKDLWGSYTEIRSGITMEDMIAFPYGSDVMDGAETNEAEIKSLYSGF